MTDVTKSETTDDEHRLATDRLRSIVERIETLEEERRERVESIADIYKEAKSAGYDVAALRQLIRIRQMDLAEVEAAQTLIETYMISLGMV